MQGRRWNSSHQITVTQTFCLVHLYKINCKEPLNRKAVLLVRDLQMMTLKKHTFGTSELMTVGYYWQSALIMVRQKLLL